MLSYIVLYSTKDIQISSTIRQGVPVSMWSVT